MGLVFPAMGADQKLWNAQCATAGELIPAIVGGVMEVGALSCRVSLVLPARGRARSSGILAVNVEERETSSRLFLKHAGSATAQANSRQVVANAMGWDPSPSHARSAVDQVGTNSEGRIYRT